MQRANFPAFWPDSQLIKMADVICHSFDNGLDFYTLAKDLESTVRGGQQGRPYHAGAAIATAVLWRCPDHTGRLPGH
ncbi:MAG: DUF732 domain-containing protein [Acidimicrobiaceae bacterium]|nr:DUF732 domain-containing protein [Acidimicrobiaceae bacterium]